MGEIGFYHGVLSDSYEEQANEQGYTLGDKAELFDKIKFSYNVLRVHGLLTDAESDRVVQRIQKKLVKTVKRLEGE